MARILHRPDSLAKRARRRIVLAAAACAIGGGIGWALDEAGRSGQGAGVTRPLQPLPAVRPSAQEAAIEIAPGMGAHGSEGSNVVLDRIEMAPSGAVVAVLSINGGAPARHLLGDSLGPGVRLARVDLDDVAIERAGRLELMRLPAGAARVRRERLAVAPIPRLSSTLPRPATPEVAQMLDSAPASAIVTASPDRANPARSGVHRMVASEALRLSTP